MLDPFAINSLPPEPMVFTDWLNVINALDMVAKAFSEVEPDKPLPRDLDGTIRRVQLASAEAAKKDPQQLIDALSMILDARGKDAETE